MVNILAYASANVYDDDIWMRAALRAVYLYFQPVFPRAAKGDWGGGVCDSSSLNKYIIVPLQHFCNNRITALIVKFFENFFFRGLPKEIEEAAFVDGAGMFYTYFRIMLANAMPSVITVSILAYKRADKQLNHHKRKVINHSTK